MVEDMPPQQVKYMTDKIPMKRCGTIDEIGKNVKEKFPQSNIRLSCTRLTFFLLLYSMFYDIYLCAIPIDCSCNGFVHGVTRIEFYNRILLRCNGWKICILSITFIASQNANNCRENMVKINFVNNKQ